MNRSMTAHLELDVTHPATVALQIGVASGPWQIEEELCVCSRGGAPLRLDEVGAGHGGRLHLVEVPVGRAVVDYTATVSGRDVPPEVAALEIPLYLRPSRYAESDRLAAFAAAEFHNLPDATSRLAAVSSWVGQRLNYVPGSSIPTHGAVETLLAGQGVCRDYAHLTIALLRALDIPARFVAVYAPGLSPMDFHAIVEALVDGSWWAVDPTLLAPRGALVRIGTGRDAADTAFLSTWGGEVELLESLVTATVDELPPDDPREPMTLG